MTILQSAMVCGDKLKKLQATPLEKKSTDTSDVQIDLFDFCFNGAGTLAGWLVVSLAYPHKTLQTGGSTSGIFDYDFFLPVIVTGAPKIEFR